MCWIQVQKDAELQQVELTLSCCLDVRRHHPPLPQHSLNQIQTTHVIIVSCILMSQCLAYIKSGANVSGVCLSGCICECVYVCMCTHIHMCFSVSICVCMHVFHGVYGCVSVYTCAYVFCVYVLHACFSVYMCMCLLCVHVCTCTLEHQPKKKPNSHKPKYSKDFFLLQEQL